MGICASIGIQMMHGFYIEGGKKNETDLSAKEKTEDERARLQKKNEH